MVSFVLTMSRFVRGLVLALREPGFSSTLILTTIILVSGTIFYNGVEGWSVIDSLYFCVMTLTTIGYGDLHPTTDLSKVFTIIYSIAGIGSFVALVTQIARAQLER